MSSAKFAVTVPAETYAAMERARRKLGKSRSATVALAIEEWLRGLEASEADRRYVEAYLRQPEEVDDVRAVSAQATSHWSSWQPGASSRASERARRRGSR
jgi:hypothetical protein